MRVLLLVLMLAAYGFGGECGGNCAAGDCPTCFCGVGMNVVDIAQWCAKSTWNQNCCKCIVSHESAGNAHAVTYN